jgi:hypothetical protein
LDTENQSLKKRRKLSKSMTGLQKNLKKESNNKNKPKKNDCFHLGGIASPLFSFSFFLFYVKENE